MNYDNTIQSLKDLECKYYAIAIEKIEKSNEYNALFSQAFNKEWHDLLRQFGHLKMIRIKLKMAEIFVIKLVVHIHLESITGFAHYSHIYMN